MNYRSPHNKPSMEDSMRLRLFLVCNIDDGKLLSSPYLLFFVGFEHLNPYSSILLALKFIIYRYFNFLKFRCSFCLRFCNWYKLTRPSNLYNKIYL